MLLRGRVSLYICIIGSDSTKSGPVAEMLVATRLLVVRRNGLAKSRS